MTFLYIYLIFSICVALWFFGYGIFCQQDQLHYVLLVTAIAFFLWPLIGSLLLMSCLTNHGFRRGPACSRCQSDTCDRRHVRSDS